jgi:hypothetical protein
MGDNGKVVVNLATGLEDPERGVVGSVLSEAAEPMSQMSASPPPKELDPRTLSKMSADLQGFLASGGDANGGERGAVAIPLLSPR